MGYYIDQLAEQDRKRRLSELLFSEGENFTVTQAPPQGNTLADIIRNPNQNWSQETKDALNAYNARLSNSSISSRGINPNFMAGDPYMPPQQQQLQQQPQVAQGDFGQVPVDTPYGRGRYMKGDNTRVVLDNGRVVDLGRDTGRERAMMKENLALEKTRAEIAAMQAKPQLESPQQKLANELIAAEARSKLPYTAEGARLEEQRRAAAKATAGEEGKPLPISAATALMSNQQSLRRAQEAQALLNGQNVGKAVGDKDATGWKGYAPDAMLQRMDPQGIDTRAAIADLGSLVIHDRSGAAVTALEFPRLQPFIPSPKDDPATARKKLNRFVMEYQNIVDEQTGFYKESGYKVPTGKLKQADIKPSANDGIPPMETWVERAKELNPDMSGAQIEAEYMKKYRR